MLKNDFSWFVVDSHNKRTNSCVVPRAEQSTTTTVVVVLSPCNVLRVVGEGRFSEPSLPQARISCVNDGEQSGRLKAGQESSGASQERPQENYPTNGKYLEPTQ